MTRASTDQLRVASAQAAVLSLAASAISMLLLPSVKCSIMAIQWTFWMHGFNPNKREDDLLSETRRVD